MTDRKATLDDWRELVKVHIRPAYKPQWGDGTDEHVDYCGKSLVGKGWTLAQMQWCVLQVVEHYRRLDNLLAMLTQASDGQRNRDGEPVGGWPQSREYRAIQDRKATERTMKERAEERDDCVARHESGPGNDCGRRACCVGCSLAPTRHNAARGRQVVTVGGFTPLAEAMQKAVTTGGK